MLLGSRGKEAWLANDTFDKNVYQLPGLDTEAASDLAERILERHGATQWRTEQSFLDLLKLLNGYPLPLEVILPNLKQKSPAEVLDALQEGAEGIDLASENKTESILRCIDYSHGNLSAEAQDLLACLAPFSGVFSTLWLKQYLERLREQDALKHLPFDRWPEVLEEAANWGLLSPDSEIPALLRLQPIFPYFLRTRLNDPARAEERVAIEIAFRQLYEGIGGALAQMLNAKEPDQRKAGQFIAGLEYPNLISALKLALLQQVSILALATAISGFLKFRQDHTRWIEVGSLILSGLEQYAPERIAGPIGLELAAVPGDVGNRFLELRRFEEAKAGYRRVLALTESAGAAGDKVAKALEAAAHHQLGMVAQEQRQWTDAERYYNKALDICVEFNDVYEQAGTYHQLGMVAEEQRRWAEAEQYYNKSLKIMVAFDDRYNQAGTYHQLGRVAQEQRQWAEAEQYYKKSLEIKVAFDDRYSQASTYHQLGRVAEEQRQWAEARGCFLKDLEISAEYEDTYGMAITRRSLARLWQASGDVELPAAVGEALGISAEDAEGMLRQALPEGE